MGFRPVSAIPYYIAHISVQVCEAKACLVLFPILFPSSATLLTFFLFIHSSGAGRVWGSDEVNIEGWKALKRLPGHESGMLHAVAQCIILTLRVKDVTDLAWSSDDRYLASVGLDSMVIVWCGLTLREHS